MRITETEKAATRERIFDSALTLFRRDGFEKTTTRDIAADAKIATGTLFNYFLTKEDIAVTIAAEALAQAHAEFKNRSASESLDEALFSFIAVGLRHLRPHKSLIPPVLETSLSPLVSSSETGAKLRDAHNETVSQLLISYGAEPPSAAAMHLYWTLYSGILRFWAHDNSHNGEDSLALLDQWIRLFAASLRKTAAASEGEQS